MQSFNDSQLQKLAHKRVEVRARWAVLQLVEVLLPCCLIRIKAKRWQTLLD